jgi:small-conductance mechanosensitive channel
VASPTLGNLQTSQAAWQSLSDKLATAQKDLSLRVQDLDTLLWQLNQMDDTWKATLDGAKKVNAPPAIIQRIEEVRALIASTMKAVQARLAPLYSMQNRVAAQEARTRSGLDTVNKAIDNARIELFKQNNPALWNPASFSPEDGGIVAREKVSLHEQLAALKAYLEEKIGAVLVHLFLLALLVMGFYWIRNTIHARAQAETCLQHAARVFDVPLATAVLLALLATWFLYPDAPRLLWAIAGATALIPAVIVTRRLIDPANFSILYATMIAYFVDQVRYVVTPAGVLARCLLIAELLAVSIFLLTALRSKHLSDSPLESNRLKRFTRIYLHLAFLVFVFAGLANVLGYTHLSVTAGEGMLDSSYLAVILYAAVRIVDALAICALNFRPLSHLGMVRRHQDLLYNNITAGIRWLIFGIWLVVSLQYFTLRDLLWQEIRQVLDFPVPWFFTDFKIGALVAFPITVWATFVLSRLIRFVLEEEVYPHFPMGRGIPYAASRMVHYTVLLLGFFAAIAATGAPLSQFSFLAGAFGVGLGFGLQNIFNNFVSGVILLFERPVKVGDTIQIGTDMGRVERIGIRASVILLGNGSEMIVPNGNLISNPVTNWTLSNCERVIEIPVNVVSKVDPQHVLNLLTEVAKSHPCVIKNPPPQALLVTFGAAVLSFRLRAWIDSEEEWMKITSDLSLAINAALAKENIAIS